MSNDHMHILTQGTLEQVSAMFTTDESLYGFRAQTFLQAWTPWYIHKRKSYDGIQLDWNLSSWLPEVLSQPEQWHNLWHYAMTLPYCKATSQTWNVVTEEQHLFTTMQIQIPTLSYEEQKNIWSGVNRQLRIAYQRQLLSDIKGPFPTCSKQRL